MLSNSQMHRLQSAAKRRRFRHLVLALQVGMLVFFSDQILKTYCSRNLEILERRPLVGEFLVLSHYLNRGLAGDRVSNVPRGFIEPYTRYIPTVVWFCLLSVFYLRRRTSSLSEMVSFALVLSGGASNLFNQWQSEFVVDTLQFYIGRGSYLPFNFADAAILIGGIFASFVLLRKIFAPENSQDYFPV